MGVHSGCVGWQGASAASAATEAGLHLLHYPPLRLHLNPGGCFERSICIYKDALIS